MSDLVLGPYRDGPRASLAHKASYPFQHMGSLGVSLQSGALEAEYRMGLTRKPMRVEELETRRVWERRAQ